MKTIQGKRALVTGAASGIGRAIAVALAREAPQLGVGLHLTLLCGHAALPSEQIPGLVDAERRFSDCPVTVGFRYFARRGLRTQLEAEIRAQFEKFYATGLPLDHVNGHLHLHLHPVVFKILMTHAKEWGIRRLRLTWDPFWLNAKLASGRWAYRVAHSIIHALLARRARPVLQRRNILHTDVVFGLLQSDRVNEEYMRRLFPVLPPGDSELYSHPSLDEFRTEFDALISPRVREQIEKLGIKLIRYQDL